MVYSKYFNIVYIKKEINICIFSNNGYWWSRQKKEATQ